MIVVGTQPGGSGGFGGGGGGGYGGFSTYTNDPPPEPTPVCSDIFRAADNERCSVIYPPTLVQNGCGSGSTEALIPDYVVGWSHFGNVLTPACNEHDTCYGTYGNDKHGCDNQLRADMIERCQMRVGGPNPPLPDQQDFLRACEAQAAAYSSGLQNGLIEWAWSVDAFNDAQAEGFCRYLADDAKRNQCLN